MLEFYTAQLHQLSRLTSLVSVSKYESILANIDDFFEGQKKKSSDLLWEVNIPCITDEYVFCHQRRKLGEKKKPPK